MRYGRVLMGAALAALITGCGEDVKQGSANVTTTLCFDYFQQCVYPQVMNAILPVDLNLDGIYETNARCADSGCHNASGNSGGGFRMGQDTPQVNITTTPRDQILISAMYTNFLAAKGFSNLSQPTASKILQEPLAQVSHGGGRVFTSPADANAVLLLNWINAQPTDGDPLSGTCPVPSPPC
jgi:hypothetical protein